ncbi:MAG: hypothetical protein J2P57_07610 [Acidimicrobiaceae bacterium]|nr:hypothetical protein [Acidimicrobiaceae bacterium]
MKKLIFLTGAGLGFVLGSYAGRQPYEQLAAKTRDVMGRPEPKDVLNRAGEAAGAAADNLSEYAPMVGGVTP